MLHNSNKEVLSKLHFNTKIANKVKSKDINVMSGSIVENKNEKTFIHHIKKLAWCIYLSP